MGKPQSKYYAKASAGNAALAFHQEYQQNGVIKTVVRWEYAQSLLILHRQEGRKKWHPPPHTHTHTPSDLFIALQHANFNNSLLHHECSQPWARSLWGGRQPVGQLVNHSGLYREIPVTSRCCYIHGPQRKTLVIPSVFLEHAQQVDPFGF